MLEEEDAGGIDDALAVLAGVGTLGAGHAIEISKGEDSGLAS
ncbi:hypothetical protein O0235_10580 [Tepidiforma flava]|uniref:Uncharacterized protein n=1 Tax=Tepidiforma flava TaxID=3004094 RepID=A0ABY7M619_9CHLR|nr:hypothetical protein [Tepidiforma flava]WBL35231.1 hypothetical protein O0235_10580 [Tepidiforma flava]